MRKRFLALLTGALVLVLSAGVGLSVAAGPASGGKGKADQTSARVHNFESPLSKQQSADRAQAKQLLLEGKIKKDAKVAKLANGRYVELARETTDPDLRGHRGVRGHCPRVVSRDSGGRAQRFEGPLHNEIPATHRKVDNIHALRQSDYSRAHYQDMILQPRWRTTYYERQSSGGTRSTATSSSG